MASGMEMVWKNGVLVAVEANDQIKKSTEETTEVVTESWNNAFQIHFSMLMNRARANRIANEKIQKEASKSQTRIEAQQKAMARRMTGVLFDLADDSRAAFKRMAEHFM
jgi:hypothetical protein